MIVYVIIFEPLFFRYPVQGVHECWLLC